MAQEWFESWFDSPYYHILYAHRDESEAKLLIENMLEYIELPESSLILDVGCGNGRHAQYLARKNFKIHGIDIAPNNISYAQKRNIPGATFQVHDMREPLPGNNYDLLLNLFTSFGYFEEETDLVKTINNFSDALKTGGYLVIDYFNAYKTLQKLVSTEHVRRKNIDFYISRKRDNDFVVKEIQFEDKGKQYFFEERVRLLTIDDFEQYFEKLNFRIRFICGDYNMTPFHPESSDRLIMIAESIVGDGHDGEE